MNRKHSFRAGHGRRTAALLVLLVLVGIGRAPAGTEARTRRECAGPKCLSAAPNPPFAMIDTQHPEAFLGPTWVGVDLPSDRVILRNLRILTANRNWNMQICESPADPGTCVQVVGPVGGSTVGWRGDYRDATWTRVYQDGAAGRKLHLLVTPAGGDWMIFRIRVEAAPQP